MLCGWDTERFRKDELEAVCYGVMLGPVDGVLEGQMWHIRIYADG